MAGVIDVLLDETKDVEAETQGVWVGLHWTAVQTKHVGMSHTYKSGKKTQIEKAGRLLELTPRQLAEMARSEDTLTASVGIASINSLIEPIGESGSINPHIKKVARDKEITIIGRFPFNDEMRRVTRKTNILEFQPTEGELPASMCDEVIPRSDVNIITATTLINHTLDHLLELGGGGYNILLGPSTPMSPILFEHGIDVLASVRVLDVKNLSSSITQGVKKFGLIGGVEPICLYKQ